MSGRRRLYERNSPARSSRKVLRISLFQNKSQRGRARSLMIASVSPTVLVDSASYLRGRRYRFFREFREYGLRKLLVEGRVDSHFRLLFSFARAATGQGRCCKKQ